MSNPFLRRATEYIRDDSAFLAIVSPEPLMAFVAKHKKRPLLFGQTVRVMGTPGSGKTMMASLVEFRLVEASSATRTTRTTGSWHVRSRRAALRRTKCRPLLRSAYP